MSDPNDPLGLGVPLQQSKHSQPVNNQAVQGLQGGVPEGMRLRFPNAPLPPEVREWLQLAQKTGRFLLFCAIVDDGADHRGEPFNVYMHKSAGFDGDWVLKAWKLMGQNIVALPAESLGEPIAPHTEPKHDGETP